MYYSEVIRLIKDSLTSNNTVTLISKAFTTKRSTRYMYLAALVARVLRLRVGASLAPTTRDSLVAVPFLLATLTRAILIT